MYLSKTKILNIVKAGAVTINAIKPRPNHLTSKESSDFIGDVSSFKFIFFYLLACLFVQYFTIFFTALQFFLYFIILNFHCFFIVYAIKCR